LACIFAACSSAARTDQAGKQVEFTPILAGQHSLADTASSYLINDKEAWDEIWHLANGDIEPMPDLPEIDFDKQMVLAVFMGRKNSGGYHNEIASINKANGFLNVKVINYERAGGTMLPVLTSPFQIVTIPKGKFKLKIENIGQKE
jgi:hypothetical protein